MDHVITTERCLVIVIETVTLTGRAREEVETGLRGESENMTEITTDHPTHGAIDLRSHMAATETESSVTVHGTESVSVTETVTVIGTVTVTGDPITVVTGMSMNVRKCRQPGSGHGLPQILPMCLTRGLTRRLRRRPHPRLLSCHLPSQRKV